jgi:hypothetical protein
VTYKFAVILTFVVTLTTGDDFVEEIVTRRALGYKNNITGMTLINIT